MEVLLGYLKIRPKIRSQLEEEVVEEDRIRNRRLVEEVVAVEGQAFLKVI